MEALQRENDKTPWTSTLERSVGPCGLRRPGRPETDLGSKLMGTFRLLAEAGAPSWSRGSAEGGVGWLDGEWTPAPLLSAPLQEPWLLRAPPCTLPSVHAGTGTPAGQLRAEGPEGPEAPGPVLPLSPKAHGPQATLSALRWLQSPLSADSSQLGFHRVGSGPFRSQAVPECACPEEPSKAKLF